ncbi:hypothetical protein C8R46DRAFT_1040762 [Mycena filopes]|nr:hypothetical protein C8R46DRAFT_1040762 [Mycena filopes]
MQFNLAVLTAALVGVVQAGVVNLEFHTDPGCVGETVNTITVHDDDGSMYMRPNGSAKSVNYTGVLSGSAILMFTSESVGPNDQCTGVPSLTVDGGSGSGCVNAFKGWFRLNGMVKEHFSSSDGGIKCIPGSERPDSR